jgi:hypothetical protein
MTWSFHEVQMIDLCKLSPLSSPKYSSKSGALWIQGVLRK